MLSTPRNALGEAVQFSDYDRAVAAIIGCVLNQDATLRHVHLARPHVMPRTLFHTHVTFAGTMTDLLERWVIERPSRDVMCVRQAPQTY